AAEPMTVPTGQPLADVVVGQFDGWDKTDPAGDYRAIIYWGDGGESAGRVVGSDGHFRVVGSHTYAYDAQGADHLAIAVIIQEPDGTWTRATADVTATPWAEGLPHEAGYLFYF